MPSDEDYAAMAYGRGNREPGIVAMVEETIAREQEESRQAIADRGDRLRTIIHGEGFTMRAADDGVNYEDEPTYSIGLLPHVGSLTFAELQHANHERGKVWGKGLDISYLFNAVELGGEAGELVEATLHAAAIAAATGKAINAVKKFYRAEIGIAGGVMDMTPVMEELGDVVICCSLLANKLGIDLGKCVAEKFNKTSAKHGFPHRLAA